MKWEVDGELLEVQGAIERARDIIENNEWKVRLDEVSNASSFYSFEHKNLGTIGSIKISMHKKRTEIYGYPPKTPDAKWLIEHLPKNIPLIQPDDLLIKLLNVYAWQIEQGIFEPSASELFRRAYKKENIDMGWERFGLADLEVQKQAQSKLGEWSQTIQRRRVEEFNQITGVLLVQLRLDGFFLVVFDGIARDEKVLKPTTPAAFPVRSEEKKAESEKIEKEKKLQEIWNKMSPKTKKYFREAWKIWNRMRRAYRLEKLDGQTKEAQPQIKDWQSKVTKELHWNVSESRLRDVKEMGESKIIK